MGLTIQWDFSGPSLRASCPFQPERNGIVPARERRHGMTPHPSSSGDPPGMRLGPVWVTGATGLIGSHLLKTAADAVPDGTIRGLSRAQVDLTDPSAVITAFHADEPRMVIHCAALSRSPDCQADPALARRVQEALAAVPEARAKELMPWPYTGFVPTGHEPYQKLETMGREVGVLKG